MSYKTITNTKTINKISRHKVLSLAAVSLITVGLASSPLVYADKFQDQINDLNQQNSSKQDGLTALGGEAANYQDAIAKLSAQITDLQNQIQANEAKKVETQAKIVDAQNQLAHNKQMLSDILKKMYTSSDMSSLEMLATSKDLGDFVDQEQYNNSIQTQVQSTLAKIKDLQAQLDLQKTNLERMIADQQDMRSKVASQQAEQQRLLGMNQQQQADLDSQIKTNNSKISDLRKQQALENSRLAGGKIPVGVPGGGGYPGVWAFAPMDTMIDSWGMYNRECVSWTAYKVAASGRYMPYWGGYGNANQWDDNARASGIPVDGNPRQGDVAVSNSGSFGHVMYVEAVADDGSIYVSDYNQQYDGLYREYWIAASTVSARSLVFIHF